MSYLELLSLSREPFSNSPDPDVFYGAQTHALCLNRLEIAIRLKRGLNVVLGRVGTGKSTLCRRLLKHLSKDDKLKLYCLLDAGVLSKEQFLIELCALFGCEWRGNAQDAIGQLQTVVYDSVLVKGIYPVLLIDEGQKLSQDQLEILRVLLNFETNTEKLLQIVIFAQPEFQNQLDAMPNFRDRINECIELKALSEEEGTALLQHRLRMAGGEQAVHLFTPEAFKVICRAAEGRPRQLVRLAHLSLLAMIMANQSTMTAKLVKAQVLKVPEHSGQSKALVIGGMLMAFCLAGLGYWQYAKTKTSVEPVISSDSQVVAQQTDVAPNVPPTALESTKTSPLAIQSEPSSVGAPSAGAEEGTLPPLMGQVSLGTHWPLEDVAMLFYSTDKAVDALRELNPDYELLKSTTIVLPRLTFDVPPQLRRNHQLAYGQFATAQAAFDALMRWESLDGRFVVRVDPDGRPHYYVMARASFRDPNRAWMWLSQQKPPKDIQPLLLPPLRDDDVAYCDFKH